MVGIVRSRQFGRPFSTQTVGGLIDNGWEGNGICAVLNRDELINGFWIVEGLILEQPLTGWRPVNLH